MNTEWTFRGEPLADDDRQRIEQQLTKIERYLREPSSAHVVVTLEGPAHQRLEIEIVIRTPDGTFAGHGEGHDAQEVAREALSRLETQVRKVHDKRLESRRRSSAAAGGED